MTELKKRKIDVSEAQESNVPITSNKKRFEVKKWNAIGQ